MATRSHKSFFMPLLCRPSINDAVKPTKLSNSSSADPSSPKLTCIGQIKKKSTITTTTTTAATATANTSNRFLACSVSSSTSAKSSGNSNLGYSKLHKLFSGKNLISPAIDTASINNFNSKCVAKRSKSCNGRGTVPNSKKKYYISSSRSIDDQDIVRVVVAEELDPPLPVVKCRRSDPEVNVNLWKRRGIEMKTLQIQPIQLTINQNSNNNNNNGGFSLPTSATTF